jgi:dynactin complex subunit
MCSLPTIIAHRVCKKSPNVYLFLFIKKYQSLELEVKLITNKMLQLQLLEMVVLICTRHRCA